MSKIKIYCYVQSRHNADDTWQTREHFLFQENRKAAAAQWNSRGNTDGYKIKAASSYRYNGPDMKNNGPVVKGAIVVSKWSKPSKFNL